MATTSTPEENEPTIGPIPLTDFPSAMIEALMPLNPQPPRPARLGFAARAPEPVFTVLQAPGFDENGNEVSA